jgi:hypothetical protein
MTIGSSAPAAAAPAAAAAANSLANTSLSKIFLEAGQCQVCQKKLAHMYHVAPCNIITCIGCAVSSKSACPVAGCVTPWDAHNVSALTAATKLLTLLRLQCGQIDLTTAMQRIQTSDRVAKSYSTSPATAAENNLISTVLKVASSNLQRLRSLLPAGKYIYLEDVLDGPMRTGLVSVARSHQRILNELCAYCFKHKWLIIMS